MSPPPSRPPRHVTVVGAGIAGLSLAWFLQERGLQVRVLERSTVAAGSSWGNAGWITPGMAIPLAEPSVLRHGLRALLDPAAPLHIPLRADPRLWGFLLRFAARCTMPTWRRTMAALVPLNRLALDAYDELEAGSALPERTRRGPIMAAFRVPGHADALLRELALIREAGLDVGASDVGGEALRALAPAVSREVTRAIRIEGQRYLYPGRFVDGLADAVRARGGELLEGAEVTALRHGRGGLLVEVAGSTVSAVRTEAVVLATGAWLPRLARTHGVRVGLRAGRGYSFSVSMPQEAGEPGIGVPVYFAHERVVCTPLGDRVRVGGTMEFRDVQAPLDRGRIDAIVAAARPLVPGLDLEERREEWVGARPITVDGLPLVGPTSAPGVWVHGGHGMWGMCQSPATARLLAGQMATGVVPEELRALAPTR